MVKYSIIIPVFNRPDEVDELLQSLVEQTFKDFEVLIIEDGSNQKCDLVCKKFSGTLNIHYYFKENSGQGFSRNYGFERANSDYFIQLDSDALLPPKYFEAVDLNLTETKWDAFGGPDKAHEDFTPIQKAVNYAMTSVFTTGGIRGQKKNLGGKYTPRSFNFGLSRKVWEDLGGYKITRMGEDIEYSQRIIQAGYKVGFINEAYIYHKRRTSFLKFYRQLFFFGRARINISKFFPDQLKLVHFFPMLFSLFILSIPFTFILSPDLYNFSILLLMGYFSLLFIDSFQKNKSLWVAILSLPACFIQLFAYGMGFIKESIRPQ